MSWPFQPLLPAGVSGGLSLSADNGSFALTGQTAAFFRSLRMDAANGSFSVNGQAVTFIRAYRLTAEAGSITVHGQNAGLRYSNAAAGNGQARIGLSLSLGV